MKLADFLTLAQQASRSVGQGVTGLVDLSTLATNAALRPFGRSIPVEQVPFSTAWAEGKGLLAPADYSPAGIAGQTLGGLLGPIGAAKAPQIAAGALDEAARLQRYNQALGPAGVSHVIDQSALKAAFPDVDFSLRQSGDLAFLDRVVVPPESRGSGVGSSFMRALTDAADADGARLGLTPSADLGGTKSRLVDFYRRFGFVPNKGRARDFELMSAMIRQPQKQGKQ